MRDPSYFIALAIVIILLLDYFFFDAYILKTIGSFILNAASQIASLFGA